MSEAQPATTVTIELSTGRRIMVQVMQDEPILDATILMGIFAARSMIKKAVLMHGGKVLSQFPDEG